MNKPLSNIVLISDMDDTLLTHDKKISEENIKAIEKFRELGGTFTVATGRSIPSFKHYMDIVNTNDYTILNNGATIYDPISKKVMWSQKLPENALELVRKTIEANKFAGCEVYMGTEIHVIQSTDLIVDHLDFEQLEVNYSKLEDMTGDCYKVLYACETDEIDELIEFTKTLDNTDVEYVKSYKWYYEMLPQNCTKGHALEELRKFEQFSDKFICAVGDYYNDVQMLINADLSFAVGNAPDDVKKHADIIVSTNEEHAIADCIEQIMKKFISC